MTPHKHPQRRTAQDRRRGECLYPFRSFTGKGGGGPPPKLLSSSFGYLCCTAKVEFIPVPLLFLFAGSFLLQLLLFSAWAGSTTSRMPCRLHALFGCIAAYRK